MKRIAIAVVEHDDQFLIGQRPPGVALAGLWEFPGGKVEPGESPAAAAIRECLEETGLRIEVVDEFPSQTETYSHGAVDLYFFLCRPLSPSDPPRDPFRWAPRADLSRYEFPSGNRQVLRIIGDQRR